MNFLQPLILAALPLMALPVLIHLINQRRHRTVPWAAMMFLVSANRMNKGMARLRYFLIMLMRMAAIGAIIFAVSRPMVSGSMGSLGLGKPDATLILLDRSASMEIQDLQTQESKRSTALKKLVELLEQRPYGSQLVLIDSASGKAQTIDSPKALLRLPSTKATSTPANVPSMLEEGLAYLKANESGRADVWILSDLNESDWEPESGRWSAIREQYAALKGVHHFLLSYADRPANNLSIRVANVKRRQIGNNSELILDVLLKTEGLQSQSGNTVRRVPIEIEVNNVRSVVEVELDAQGAEMLGYRIPIDNQLGSGWGSVALPGDSNPLDNRFYFAFSAPPVQNAVIVTDDAKNGAAFRRVLGIPTETHLEQSAKVLTLDQVSEINWEETGLLIWQSPLPTGLVAKQIEQFVESGRVVVFFPPSQTSDEQLFATQWGQWSSLTQEHRKVSWWRGDADLFEHAGSGDALPLNELQAYQYCSIETPSSEKTGTPLAKLGGDLPLLFRAATDSGGAYFCSTLPTAQFSSLERDGIVFYVMLQRALSEGSRSLSVASQRDAADGALEDLSQPESLASSNDAPSVSQFALLAGVYSDGESWVAVNRSLAEDSRGVATAETVDGLFDGLSYQRIDDSIGNESSLASEIWRLFLFVMALALIVEAALCLPVRKIHRTRVSEFASAGSNLTQESM